jgi:DNA-binding CsgD family transcriptional regulator
MPGSGSAPKPGNLLSLQLELTEDTPDVTRIIGRDREIERVAGFLGGESGAGCVVLLGEPGVGKTTLWRHGVEVARARGFTLLLCRPLELDMRVPFAGLRDLLAGVLDEVLAVLPGPQRRALGAALRLADPPGGPPEPSAIAFALHSGLEAVARRAPVLIGIDDMQWLDQPSAGALRFALHRLGSVAIRMLVAQRAEGPGSGPLDLDRVFDAGRYQPIELGGLSPGSIQQILGEQLAVALPRPLLTKVHASSGGNPFFALELVRAFERHGGRVAPGRGLPVPDSLSALLDERLAALPREAERCLEVVALLSDPTTTLIRAAADGDVDLAAAVTAGVAELVPSAGGEVADAAGERIRFSHPLLASAVTARMGEETRRGLHRRLAGLVADQEERARHLALGTSGEDPAVAATLEEAARLASARGAPAAAAELLEYALLHTPPRSGQARSRRLLAAAEANFAAGDWDRAIGLASQSLDQARAGPERVRALALLGELDGRIAGLEESVAEAGDDALLRARLRLQLSINYFARNLRESLRLAGAAADDAAAAGDRALLAQALSMRSWFEGATLSGDPDATAALAARLEQDAGLEIKGEFTSDFTSATLAMWRDEHELARQRLDSLRDHAVHRGNVYDQAHALLNLAQVEWRAGSWDRAAAHVGDAAGLWPHGDRTARSLAHWMGAVLASHRGDLDVARADAAEGLAAAGEHLVFRARNLWVIGFADLCAGHVGEALSRLKEAAALFDDVGALEPGMRLFTSDLLDAYLAAGELGSAESLAGEFLQRGAELGRPRATVIGSRGHGLVLAARGELAPALSVLTSATVAAERWPVPLEHGRTLLALGTVQRRARQRRQARTTLERAREIFRQIGAPIFALRAQAELDRIGGRTPASQLLTPAEQRIADLVARGLTNREVAAELVVAIHTVEAALTRIYAKLNIRSRTELARDLAERLGAGSPDAGS